MYDVTRKVDVDDDGVRMINVGRRNLPDSQEGPSMVFQDDKA